MYINSMSGHEIGIEMVKMILTGPVDKLMVDDKVHEDHRSLSPDAVDGPTGVLGMSWGHLFRTSVSNNFLGVGGGLQTGASVTI